MLDIMGVSEQETSSGLGASKEFRGHFPGGPRLRTHLPRQGVQVPSLIQEDPDMPPGQPSPCTPRPMFHNKRSHGNNKFTHNERVASVSCN